MAKKGTLEKRAANKNGAKRFAFAALSIILEIVFWILLFYRLNAYSTIINVIVSLSGAVLVLAIYGRSQPAALKIPWIILILIMPVFGVVLYALVGMKGHTKKMRLRYQDIDEQLLPLLDRNEAAAGELRGYDQDAAAIASYIYGNAGYPVYNDSDVEYFDDASKALEAQLEELAKAQHFIFMEYHAIENESAWKRIQAVLEDRVKAGVEVRVFYDDLGSIFFITTDFAKSLEKAGIRCRVFNPFTPGLNMFLNNRDHRKITVIDGKVGFTGGYNLANEYFNITHPYGMWKDSGIRIRGSAVRNMTITFLEMWNAVKEDDQDDMDFTKYLPHTEYSQKEEGAFIQPYADSPLDNMHIGEDVYINMVNKANEYCYFTSPYLIISDELSHALRLAAMRGVDVRIITPGIPDKKTVYSVTRSFYHALVADGVKIYEWTPGFFHAKLSVADDKMATCGTINMDYRSLYHHFENGCFLANCQAVLDIKQDFLNEQKKCRDVTDEYREIRSIRLRAKELFLRLFAGMM